jgi:hypothetical protein
MHTSFGEGDDRRGLDGGREEPGIDAACCSGSAEGRHKVGTDEADIFL